MAIEMIQHPSPNHGPRKGGAAIDMVILHYTAMEAYPALDRLCDPEWEVSAHYLICPQGRIFQLVCEDARAWHAGRAKWGDVDDVNSRSIGIELANLGDHPFAHPQMEALCELLAGIRLRHGIRPERVLAHSDIAPDRKGDPGSRFDWPWLAREGHVVSLDPSDAPVDADQFCRYLGRAGYDTGLPLDTLLTAFRLRHRTGQHPDGLQPGDMGMARALAHRFPCG